MCAWNGRRQRAGAEGCNFYIFSSNTPPPRNKAWYLHRNRCSPARNIISKECNSPCRSSGAWKSDGVQIFLTNNPHIATLEMKKKKKSTRWNCSSWKGLQICPSTLPVKAAPLAVGPCHWTGLSESDRILTSASPQRWGCRTKSTSDNWPVSLCIHAWL